MRPAVRAERVWEAALGLGIDVRPLTIAESMTIEGFHGLAFYAAYSARRKTIVVSSRFRGHPHAPMIMAHEVGHALIFRERPWSVAHQLSWLRRAKQGCPTAIMKLIGAEREADSRGAAVLSGLGLGPTKAELSFAEKSSWSLLDLFTQKNVR